MKQHGLPEAEFQNLSGGFEVILPGPGKAFEEEIEKEKLHKLEINRRQRKALKYLESHESINRRTYMNLNSVSNKTAFVDLKDLVDKKILMKKGKGRAVIYRLKR